MPWMSVSLTATESIFLKTKPKVWACICLSNNANWIHSHVRYHINVKAVKPLWLLRELVDKSTGSYCLWVAHHLCGSAANGMVVDLEPLSVRRASTQVEELDVEWKRARTSTTTPASSVSITASACKTSRKKWPSLYFHLSISHNFFYGQALA